MCFLILSYIGADILADLQESPFHWREAEARQNVSGPKRAGQACGPGAVGEDDGKYF